MKIAVFSDIHDHHDNLEKFFENIKDKNVQELICLGDFISPGIVKRIIDSGFKTYAVWGNNEGEIMKITRFVMETNGNFVLSSNTESILEIDKKRVYLNHYPEIINSMAKSGDFDAVFYGHNHQEFYKQLQNGCIICNPGEICGYKTNRVTYAIWDTQSNTVEQFELN